MELDEVAARVAACEGCGLCKTRTQVVPGTGDPSAQIMIIGEGPGEQEDLHGLPFVGRSGDLLNRALDAAGLSREQVFITNVVKCRPPGNRNPSLEEMDSCFGFLWEQIQAVNPRMIITLGKVASEFLLGQKVMITQENGHLHFPKFVDVLMTVYHPAYVLRNKTPQVEKAFQDAFLAIPDILHG